MTAPPLNRLDPAFYANAPHDGEEGGEVGFGDQGDRQHTGVQKGAEEEVVTPYGWSPGT
jgi:hypothetical protein